MRLDIHVQDFHIHVHIHQATEISPADLDRLNRSADDLAAAQEADASTRNQQTQKEI